MVGGITGHYLYLKWQNIEANAGISSLGARYHNSELDTYDTYINVGPFQLSFPNPTFVGGATKNIPCYSTNPVTISLNPYINTADNGIDKDLEITNDFTWTLPSGWQTSSGKTGTFDANSSISVIPSVSSSSVAILVQPYADAGQGIQYGPTVSLQITRNLKSFTISGQSPVLCNTTNRYTAPAATGVSYTWQLPAGWTGTSTTNYIDVVAKGASGSISCTMTGCNGPKSSSKSIIVDLSNPGISISGPSIVCSSGNTFTISNLPPYNSIVWTPGPYLTISSGQNTASCTFSPTVSGNSTIDVKLVTDCGDIPLPQRTVWAGSPTMPGTISFEMDAPPNRFTATIEPVPTATTYNWYLNGVLNNTYHDTGAIFNALSPYCGGSYSVEVQAYNNCGWSVKKRMTAIEPSCLYAMIISPNPTESESTIEIYSQSEVAIDVDIEWQMEVYDQMQTSREKQTKIKGCKTKLSINGWKDGIYFIQAIVGNEKINGTLVVKH